MIRLNMARDAATALIRGGLALTLLLSAAACGPGATGKPPASTAPAPDASTGPREVHKTVVQIKCQPADARVLVNGQAQGTAEQIAAAGGLRLPPGLHRFEISRKRYRTYRIELILGDRAESLEIKLQRKGRGSR